jgi:phage terminase large subunit-like protein
VVNPAGQNIGRLEDLLAVKAFRRYCKMECSIYAGSDGRRRSNHLNVSGGEIGRKNIFHLLNMSFNLYDTAFMKKETADYSAITTWGVFHLNEDSGPQLILLDARKERLEFPELRRLAHEQYMYWQPETVLVEAKASGLPLTYELRNMGIPVINFSPQ